MSQTSVSQKYQNVTKGTNQSHTLRFLVCDKGKSAD